LLPESSTVAVWRIATPTFRTRLRLSDDHHRQNSEICNARQDHRQARTQGAKDRLTDRAHLRRRLLRRARSSSKRCPSLVTAAPLFGALFEANTPAKERNGWGHDCRSKDWAKHWEKSGAGQRTSKRAASFRRGRETSRRPLPAIHRRPVASAGRASGPAIGGRSAC
jgi:hypothetical protein